MLVREAEARVSHGSFGVDADYDSLKITYSNGTTQTIVGRPSDSTQNHSDHEQNQGAPKGGRSLTGDEKQILSPFLPKADIDTAVVHFGETPRLGFVPFPMPKKSAAVTVHNQIYMRKEVLRYSRIKFLAALAHELFHVDQFRTGTMTWASYLKEAHDHGTFMDNKFEAPAYRFETAVEQHLQSVGTAWDGTLIVP